MLEETVSDATTFSRDGVIAMSFYTLSFQKLPDLTETFSVSAYMKPFKVLYNVS